MTVGFVTEGEGREEEIAKHFPLFGLCSLSLNIYDHKALIKVVYIYANQENSARLFLKFWYPVYSKKEQLNVEMSGSQ